MKVFLRQNQFELVKQRYLEGAMLSRLLTGVKYRGGVAVASIAYRGVLAADVPGGPPAGSVLELLGKSEFELRATAFVGRGPSPGLAQG